MDKLQAKIIDNLKGQNFDTCAIGVLDFNDHSFQSFEFFEGKKIEVDTYTFDLASLTKPLTLGLAYLIDHKNFTQEELLLLEHRASLPFWGRLDRLTFKEQMLSYSVKESHTVYSDFGALRLMLELEKRWKTPLYEKVSYLWNEGIMHWSEVNKLECVVTGFRNGSPIQGDVHDDNAYVLKDKLSHAGLFSNISSLCQSLINIDKECDLLNFMKNQDRDDSKRFLRGWDTVSDLESTLAGKGCTKNTFGHLGFTGTSIWIDADKRIGHIILTNETKKFWYDRSRLNEFRRVIGSEIWHSI